MSDELKPCPFCPISCVDVVPHETTSDRYPDGIDGYQVGCGRCGSMTGVHRKSVFPDPRQSAIDFWNTRPREVAADDFEERIDRARRACDGLRTSLEVEHERALDAESYRDKLAELCEASLEYLPDHLVLVRRIQELLDVVAEERC